MDIQIRIAHAGGPDALEAVPSVPQEPGPGEIRLRQYAVGVNFIDIYHRRGIYDLPEPRVPGVEGAGTVDATGPGVKGVRIGDRVAYAGVPGGYASTRILPAWRAVRLPQDIPFPVAAASMLRGLTAHMLLTVTYPVQAGSVLLVHAAAGGLGQMLTRWAKHLGATVIGTTGSAEKADIARSSGADHVIVGRNADLETEVAALTNGAGADCAIDGIGGSMLQRSLRCVRAFGTVASIGWVAGPVPPIEIAALGTAMLGKPSVMAYAADPDRYLRASEAVVAALAAGIVCAVGGDYALADAATAQQDLEAGRSTGSLILVP